MKDIPIVGKTHRKFIVMPVKHVYKLFILIFILVASPIICNSCNTLPTITKSGTPVITDSPVSTPTAQQLNVWQQVRTGVELRYEHWKSPGPDEDTVVILRFNLNSVHIKVGYQPSQPMGLSDWLQQEHAFAAINGGYFDNQHKATALIITNGQSYGTSYTGFGGMLSVDAQGSVQLRSLRQQPYDSNTEQLQQATQSSPMLMIDGKRTQFNADAANQARSVVAMDKQGRLLFIVVPNTNGNGGFALDELADLLASSDLSLQNALNLDGGASTGLYMNGGTGKQQVTIDSIAALPIAIVVK